MEQITAGELLEKQFKTKRFGGYDPVDVITTVREAAGTIQDLREENESLRAEVARLTHDLEQYQKLQESLNAALITAQKSAEDTRASAQREADAIVSEAKAKAKETLFAVRQAIRKTDEELAAAQRDREQFLISFEALLLAHLQWVRSQPKGATPNLGEALLEESPAPQPESQPHPEENA